MDIGIQQITTQIASSTTGYLVTFSPIFLLVGGLILAIVVIASLLGFMPNSKKSSGRDGEYDIFDDVIDW